MIESFSLLFLYKGGQNKFIIIKAPGLKMNVKLKLTRMRSIEKFGGYLTAINTVDKDWQNSKVILNTNSIGYLKH